jgi:serine/threonine protein kinase
LKEEI